MVSREDKSSQVLDLNSLVVVMRMLGYHCSLADQAEMRTWLLNQGCFASGPSFLEKHVIFIDRGKLIAALKEHKRSHYTELQQVTLPTGKGALLPPAPRKDSPYSAFESWMAVSLMAGPVSQALQAI